VTRNPEDGAGPAEAADCRGSWNGAEAAGVPARSAESAGADLADRGREGIWSGVTPVGVKNPSAPAHADLRALAADVGRVDM